MINFYSIFILIAFALKAIICTKYCQVIRNQRVADTCKNMIRYITGQNLDTL